MVSNAWHLAMGLKYAIHIVPAVAYAKYDATSTMTEHLFYLKYS